MADPDVASDALLDEALKKGALVWLRVAGREHARWHVWSGGHVYLLTGPGEQPDPGLPIGGSVQVVVRSKDNRHRLVEFEAEVSEVRRQDADWDAATSALAGARLNLAQAETAPGRWAADGSVVFRLTPHAARLAGGSGSGRSEPPPTGATTAGGPQRVLHRRARRPRPLS